MATEVLHTTDAAGGNVYFAIWKSSAAEVLDFDDDTFKALGSAVTPYVACTERTGQCGTGESDYSASIDLDVLNSTPLIESFFAESLRRVGGSPDLSTDIFLGRIEIRVASGKLVTGSVGELEAGYTVKVSMNVTSTAGDEVQLSAWVEANGQPVDLAAAECTFECIEYDSEVAHFSQAAVTANAIGVFEYLKALPNFQDDVRYLLRATITVGSATIVGQDALPVIGGA